MVFGWIVILCLIVPGCIGFWRARCLSVKEGEGKLVDLYRMFLLDKQGIPLDLNGIINGISQCQEVLDLVQRSEILRSRKALRTSVQTAEYCQMAEMLIQGHLQNQYFPPNLEKLKEELLISYTNLTTHLLKLVTQTKNPYLPYSCHGMSLNVV